MQVVPCNWTVTSFGSYITNAICNLVKVTETELTDDVKKKLENAELLVDVIQMKNVVTLYQELVIKSKCRFYETHWKPPEDNIGSTFMSIMSTMFTLLLAVSLICNLACIQAARQFFKVERATGYALISLAVSDLLNTLALYPIEMNNLLHNMFWKLGYWSCKLLPFLASTTSLASSFTLCCIAVGRCVTVVRACRNGPQRANKYSKITALCLSMSWVLAVGMSWVYLRSFEVKSFYADPRTELCDKRSNGKERKYQTVDVCFYESRVFKSDLLTKYYLYILPSSIFIPLFLIICGGYTYLSYFLWSRPMSTKSNCCKTKYKKVIRVLFGLVAVFFICRLPGVVYGWLVGLREYEVGWKVVHIRFYLVLLKFVNCTLNPFLYGMLKERFRFTMLKVWHAFKKPFLCLKCGISGTTKPISTDVDRISTPEPVKNNFSKIYREFISSIRKSKPATLTKY